MADLEATHLRPLLPGEAPSSGSVFTGSAGGHLTGLAHAAAGASASSGGSPPASQPRPPASWAAGASQASLMMRFVDDFLVFTPSRAAAEAIVRQATRGELLCETATRSCNNSTQALAPLLLCSVLRCETLLIR